MGQGRGVMRVAVEATSAAPGGGLSFLRGALRALAERGDVEIDLFVQPALARESFGPGVSVHVTGPFRGLVHRLGWVQSAFPRRVAAHDVVFAPGNLAPLPAARRTVLFVQNAHVVPQTLWRAEYRRPKRRLQRLMARLSIRRAAQVLFVSETLKTWAQPWWQDRGSEPGVAYPGLTLAPERVEERRAGRDVLLVGNLVPHKRVDRAIRAFALLTRRDGRAGRLRIAGLEAWPGLLGRLRALVAREGIEERVDFLGFVDVRTLAHAYATSGCYLTTSALESLGFPALEAMAAGTPVVVPDTAVFHEICGPAGMYFSDHDDAVVARLAASLDRPPGEHGLRRAAREQLTKFSWPVFADRLRAALGAVTTT